MLILGLCVDFCCNVSLKKYTKLRHYIIPICHRAPSQPVNSKPPFCSLSAVSLPLSAFVKQHTSMCVCLQESGPLTPMQPPPPHCHACAQVHGNSLRAGPRAGRRSAVCCRPGRGGIGEAFFAKRIRNQMLDGHRQVAPIAHQNTAARTQKNPPLTVSFGSLCFFLIFCAAFLSSPSLSSSVVFP